MTRLTIRGADTAQAMDEVLRVLGPDALILSTRQHRGVVEIEAASADEADLTPAPRPEPSFAATLLSQLAARRGGAGRADCLPPHLPRRVVLVGPPGSGRSLLAARLAAASLRLADAPRPRLIAPRTDSLTPPGVLSRHARLMGLVPDRPVWRPGQVPALPAPAPDEVQIIDLSDLDAGAQQPDALAPLAELPGTALWLVIPTGLHPDWHDRLSATWAGRASMIVLTRADLCPPTADDMSLPEQSGLPLGLIAAGTGLLDALSPAMTAPAPEPEPDPIREPTPAPEPEPAAVAAQDTPLARSRPDDMPAPAPDQEDCDVAPRLF